MTCQVALFWLPAHSQHFPERPGMSKGSGIEKDRISPCNCGSVAQDFQCLVKGSLIEGCWIIDFIFYGPEAFWKNATIQNGPCGAGGNLRPRPWMTKWWYHSWVIIVNYISMVAAVQRHPTKTQASSGHACQRAACDYDSGYSWCKSRRGIASCLVESQSLTV